MKALTAFIIRKIIKRRKFHCLLLGQLKADQIKVIKAITGIKVKSIKQEYFIYITCYLEASCSKHEFVDTKVCFNVNSADSDDHVTGDKEDTPVEKVMMVKNTIKRTNPEGKRKKRVGEISIGPRQQE